MGVEQLLWIFVCLRIGQHLCERHLARINKSYYSDPNNRSQAMQLLNISTEDMEKTLKYSDDKFAFATLSGWVSLAAFLIFLILGGFGLVEQAAVVLAESMGRGQIVTGLIFFALLSLLSMFLGLPFDYYRTFVLEERHGFNRQTKREFWLDRCKGIGIGAILGGAILALILWIMESFTNWWVVAWIALSAFSLLTMWIYPTLLAPLFNKFKPIDKGDLRDQIFSLADKIGFKTGGIYVMDASRRSSHGNAYFTGLFGERRIVLFDTLIEAMNTKEIVAVLAHELGHFKLHHVRWQLLRGILMTGVMFFLLSLCLPQMSFYTAFHLQGVTNYGALIVFSTWFGVLDFVLQPLGAWLSRRNEFAADDFARQNLESIKDLCTALLKLREKSHVMPISHPLFSMFYHSHPPLVERLTALGHKGGG